VQLELARFEHFGFLGEKEYNRSGMNQEAPVRTQSINGEVSVSLPEPVASLAKSLGKVFHDWSEKEGGEPKWGDRYEYADAEIMELFRLLPEIRNKVGYLEWRHNPEEGPQGAGSVLIGKETKKVVEIKNFRCYFSDGSSALLLFLRSYADTHKICYLVYRDQ